MTVFKPLKSTYDHPMGNKLCKRMNLTLLNTLKALPTNFKIDR